ncbi:hydantoinase/oxoprolinase family protein [Alphaproteobacteria bacterium]|nr:hydantoinase/oxoprolinase family protein [Alphaproteobacteria bacterium]
MGKILGLDTGGTFTDAAIIDTADFSVISTAKSFTTRQDLSIGVGNAMRIALGIQPAIERPSSVLEVGNKIALDDIKLVSLSTTLATNSIVEKTGNHVALILIGFDSDTLTIGNLGNAVAHSPVIFITGGHKSDGTPQLPLDTETLLAAIKTHAPHVTAFAVAGYFATRNPEHEVMARDLIRQHTQLPVSCSYELSSSLGGPKRALTAFFNAQLISLLKSLIDATQQQMKQIGLSCKLMVVKGDGNLVSADFAKERPVETILSGPAASVSGAAFLAKEKTAIISDIGGTTTDIAILKNGSVDLNSDGAKIGDWKTMVEAVNIWTSGIGGDSEIHIGNQLHETQVKIGPRRALPLCVLAEQFPQCLSVMEKQLSAPIGLSTDGRFIIPLPQKQMPKWLSKTETKMAERLTKNGVSAIADVADTQVALGTIDRLINKNLAQLSCFTPTDAAHVLNKFTMHDKDAANLGAALLARQKTGNGLPIANSAPAVSILCLNYLHFLSALKISDAAIEEDTGNAETATKTPTIKEALYKPQKKSRFLDHYISMSVPIIALGASAHTYYPDIAKRLNARLILPDFAEVAGAVGAAIGHVIQKIMITVTQPSEGIFRVHSVTGIKDFSDLEQALENARSEASKRAEKNAQNAGAIFYHTTLSEKIETADIGNGKNLFIEANITAEARGTAD